jgi:predicted O-methyltransferase YrrM
MKQKHPYWNIKYLKNRIFVYLYERLNPLTPWITKKAIDYLNSNLKNNYIGFEWGSGKSTIWLAKRVKKLVSVENDIYWYKKIKLMLENYYFNENEKKDNPSHSRYINLIDKFENEYFDFIFVDGIFRDHCALKSIKKLKKGGILVIDDIHWFLPSNSKTLGSISLDKKPLNALWERFIKEIMNWEKIWTTNGIHDTGIFIKN